MNSEAHDPTRAGAPVDASAAVLSAGEVEALCQKAARGAGLPWGLAEEAGFAARWLHLRGLDGLEALVAVLEAGALSAPRLHGYEVLPASEGVLSPVTLGALLSDLAGAERLRLGPVLRPGLLLPFLYQNARLTGVATRIESGGVGVLVTPQGDLQGPATALLSVPVAEVEIRAADGTVAVGTEADATLPCADAATLARLNALALRTTVPATEASRADAGAEADDND